MNGVKERESNVELYRIAQSIFGVLLIHASSDFMRTFLWVKLLNVPGIYNNSFVFYSIAFDNFCIRNFRCLYYY